MIALQQISKTFGQRVILDNVSFQFPNGRRIALVGANGAGKTTLLNMICGIEELDDGQVIYPQDTRVGYLPQEPNQNPEATVLAECVSGAKKISALKAQMESSLARSNTSTSEADIQKYAQAEDQYRLHGGYEIQAKAQKILDGLGFSDEAQKNSPLNLSGGWRMRLELAKILLDNPDFLILDEPTNHLDLPALAWVEDYLRKFQGTVIFVSHDRALLDRLSDITLHLSRGHLRSYTGGFSKFLEQSLAEQEQREASLESLQRKRASMERFVERFGAKASKATQAQSRVKMIEKLRALESDFAPAEQEQSMHLHLDAGAPSGRQVCTAQELHIGYDKPLTSPIDFTLERGQRVAVIGANGLGKSTLLKTLIAKLPSINGTCEFGHQVRPAYFAQDQLEEFQEQQQLLDALMEHSPLGQAEARQLLGSLLFSGDDVDKKVRMLSGGERSRLGLARVLAQKANFLILDEPTNHLDMTSVEVLANALSEFKGSVLFVSHDRQFIDQVCTHVLVLTSDGQSMLFPGQLADYERLAATAGFPNILQVEPDETLKAKEKEKSTQGETRSEQKQNHQLAKQLKSKRQSLSNRLSKLEKEMEKLDQQIAELESELAGVAPTAFEQLQKISKSIQDIRNHKDEAENAWLETSEELEAANEELNNMGRG